MNPGLGADISGKVRKEGRNTADISGKEGIR